MHEALSPRPLSAFIVYEQGRILITPLMTKIDHTEQHNNAMSTFICLFSQTLKERRNRINILYHCFTKLR